MNDIQAPGLSCIDRRPGHEVAFGELVDRRTTDAAGLIGLARRLYLAHAQTLGHEPVAWEELGVLTVRAWVAAAREARAVYAREVLRTAVSAGER